MAILHLLTILLLPFFTDAASLVRQQPQCVVESQPNPIGAQYPDLPTGTLNATLMIVTIPLDMARRLVQWPILTHAYTSLIPGFSADSYPVLVQAALDHDVGVEGVGVHVPDFTRFGYSFPFVDLLGDNTTSFSWSPAQMINKEAEFAIIASRSYGTIVYPATFDPTCNAYADGEGRLYFKGESNVTEVSQRRWVNMTMTPVDGEDCNGGGGGKGQGNGKGKGEGRTYPLEVYRNITNQPIFGDGLVCDRMVRLFNTSLSAGAKRVNAKVEVNLEPLRKAEFEGEAWIVDTAFVEHNGADCGSLRGYDG